MLGDINEDTKSNTTSCYRKTLYHQINLMPRGLHLSSIGEDVDRIVNDYCEHSITSSSHKTLDLQTKVFGAVANLSRTSTFDPSKRYVGEDRDGALNTVKVGLSYVDKDENAFLLSSSEPEKLEKRKDTSWQ